MELPGVLREIVIGSEEGFIELCPQEYDVSKLSALIEEALADCEALALSVGGEFTVSGDRRP